MKRSVLFLYALLLIVLNACSLVKEPVKVLAVLKSVDSSPSGYDYSFKLIMEFSDVATLPDDLIVHVETPVPMPDTAMLFLRPVTRNSSGRYMLASPVESVQMNTIKKNFPFKMDTTTFIRPSDKKNWLLMCSYLTGGKVDIAGPDHSFKAWDRSSMPGGDMIVDLATMKDGIYRAVTTTNCGFKHVEYFRVTQQ